MYQLWLIIHKQITIYIVHKYTWDLSEYIKTIFYFWYLNISAPTPSTKYQNIKKLRFYPSISAFNCEHLLFVQYKTKAKKICGFDNINLPWSHVRSHTNFGPDRFMFIGYKQRDTQTSKVYIYLYKYIVKKFNIDFILGYQFWEFKREIMYLSEYFSFNIYWIKI